MPKYNLLCSRDHKFEGWFASEKSYLDQKTKKLIACPICDNTGVRRAGERDDHIYGTASDKEITDLHKEGIGAIRIPNVKDN